jgi:hypothetical protein
MIGRNYLKDLMKTRFEIGNTGPLIDGKVPEVKALVDGIL